MSFRKRFPKLCIIAEQLHIDSGGYGGNCYKTILWSLPRTTLQPFEDLATNMTDLEVIEFVLGEEEEVQKLIEKYGLETLHEFVYDLFDGDQEWISKYV